MLRKPIGLAIAAVLAMLVEGFAPAASAAGFSTLYAFSGSPDGSNAQAPLIADAAGALYGTTAFGGQPGCGGSGCGTVFKLTPPSGSRGWSEEILYSFTGGPDGAAPAAGLIFDAAGALYGTASGGGNPGPGCGGTGCGTVFKLTPPVSPGGNWSQTVVYAFSGGTDGSNPIGGVVFDAAGALYGAAPNSNDTLIQQGSDRGPCYFCGVVYKLTPPVTPGGPWTEMTLVAFTSGSEGFGPAATLVIDAAGALYGTAGPGVSNLVTVNQGTVFKLSPPAQAGGIWSLSILHAFEGSDGAWPSGALAFDAGGALYGTTKYGGGGGNCSFQGCGTVFKLSPPPSPGGAWIFNKLYSFTGGADGGVPVGGPAIDASGAVYGTAGMGGATGCAPDQGCGVVFKLIPSATSGGPWTESVLYAFTGGADGGGPVNKPLLDGAGSLYGATELFGPYGGSTGLGNGTVFKISGLDVTATLSVVVAGRGVVTSVPVGINCGAGGAACAAGFSLGSQIQLLPSALNANWIFLGWGGACHGRGACIVTMSADRSVEARFRLIR